MNKQGNKKSRTASQAEPRKKPRTEKGDNASKGRQADYHCETCGQTFTSRYSYSAHFQGTAHKNAAFLNTVTPTQKGQGTKRGAEEDDRGDSKRQRVDNTAEDAGEGPSSPLIVVDKEDVCAICQDTMWDQRTTPGALVQLGTCKHVFHSECIESCSHQWRNHCPLCKTYYSVRRAGIRPVTPPVEPTGTDPSTYVTVHTLDKNRIRLLASLYLVSTLTLYFSLVQDCG